MDKFTGKFAHVGFSIANLEKTIGEMERILGDGSFQIIEEVNVPDVDYKGLNAVPDLRVGIGSLSGLPVELIEQSDEAPSPYLDDIKKSVERPHHLAFASSNFKSDRSYLEKQGGEVIYSSNLPGTSFAYFEFKTLPGLVIELMEVPAE